MSERADLASAAEEPDQEDEHARADEHGGCPLEDGLLARGADVERFRFLALPARGLLRSGLFGLGGRGAFRGFRRLGALDDGPFDRAPGHYTGVVAANDPARRAADPGGGSLSLLGAVVGAILLARRFCGSGCPLFGGARDLLFQAGGELV